MKMKNIRSLLLVALAMLTVACGTTNTVPITGRKTRLLVDDAQVLSLSSQQYQDYMKGAQLSTNTANTAMVKRVGQRLATAVETYLKDNGYASELQNYQWEFNLVANNQVNAFCMPGGKIVVYEGMLPVTQDETSLAIVLGHEIAHAVAKHSAEQLSKQMRQQYAAQIGSSVLSQAAQAKGLGSTTTAIADMVGQEKDKPSPLQKGMDELSRTLGIAVIVICAIVIVILMKTKHKDKTMSFLKNLFPPVRRLSEKLSASRVAGILGLMLHSGFPMENALEMAPAALADQESINKVNFIREEMKKDQSFQDALAKSELFADFHNRMLKVGAASGHEPQVMEKIAEIYEEQVEDGLDHLISIVEPTLVALLSIVIGAILLSVMLPMAGVLSSM